MKKWLIIGSLVVISAGGLYFLKEYNQRTSIFTGTVTAVNNGCNADGACSIAVDGKYIVTGGGLSVNASGNIYGVSYNAHIGDIVSVKAKKTSSGYTLQGCQTCYIKQQ